MKKIIKICSFFIATIFIIFLASCNKSDFTVDCDARVTARRDQITVSASFVDSKSRIFDSVIPYVSIYEVVDGKEGEQKDSNSLAIKTGTDVATNTSSNEVTFKNLDEFGTYIVKILATYESKNYTLYEETHTLSNLGTEENPIKINSVESFINNVKYDRKGYFELENDIDFNNETIDTMWSTSSEPFAGQLDGKGHTIKNFKINATNTYSGLFGYNKGNIKNLTIDNSTLDINKSSDIHAGILCGSSKGQIENVTIKNSKVTGKDNTFSYKHKFNIGLLVGLVEESTISKVVNCNVLDSNLTVGAKLEANIGGLIGEIGSSTELRNTPQVNNNKVEKTEVVVDQSIETSISYKVVINVGGLIGQTGSSVRKAVVNDVNIKLTTKTSPKATVTSGLKGYDVSLGGVIGKNLTLSNLDNVMFKGKLELDTKLQYEKPTNEEDKVDTVFNGYVGGIIGNDLSSKKHANVLADVKEMKLAVVRENATGDVTLNHGVIFGVSVFKALTDNNVINYSELIPQVSASENVSVKASELTNLSQNLASFDEIIKNIYA